MKILHLADIHCREKDLDEVKKVLGAVSKTVLDERPNLIVVAGDVFDDRNIKLDSEAVRFMFDWCREIASVAPMAVVLGTPSHDGRAAQSLVYSSNKHNIWVSYKPEQIYLRHGSLSDANDAIDPESYEAIISMVPTPTKQFWAGEGDIAETDAGIAEAMSGIFSGFGAAAAGFDCPHILVGHFTVRGAAVSGGQVMIGRDIEIGADQIAMAKADVVCLGHIHKYQFIQPNIYYSGSIYRLNYGETGAKGFMVHDVSRYGRESHFVEVPARKLVKIDFDLVENTDIEIEGLNEALLHSGKISDIKDGHIKIELKINQDDAAKLNMSAIEKRMMNAGAKSVDISLIRVPRETVRSAEILKMTSLRDKIVERARLVGETVADSILLKSDRLESELPEEIIKSVQEG